MVGDLEHVPGAGLAQDVLDRQHAQLEDAFGAGGTGQPHQGPVARGIDRRSHAQAERARHHVLRRGTAGVSGDARVVADGVKVACEPEIGGAGRPLAGGAVQAMAGGGDHVLGDAERCAHHGSANIEEKTDLLLHVLIFSGQWTALVAAEHGHRLDGRS